MPCSSAPTTHRSDVELKPLGPVHADALVVAVRGLAVDPPTAGWWARSDYSRDTARRFIELAGADRAAVRGDVFVITPANDQQTVLGCCSLEAVDWVHGSAAAHVWLTPAARGEGRAAAALYELWRIARSRGLNRLDFLIPATNAAAQALMGRLGATLEGTLSGRFLLNGYRVDGQLFTLYRAPGT